MELSIRKIGRTYSIIMDDSMVVTGGFFSRGGAQVVMEEMQRTAECYSCGAPIHDPALHPFCSARCVSTLVSLQ